MRNPPHAREVQARESRVLYFAPSISDLDAPHYMSAALHLCSSKRVLLVHAGVGKRLHRVRAWGKAFSALALPGNWLQRNVALARFLWRSRKRPALAYLQGSPNAIYAPLLMRFGIPYIYHSQDFLEPGRHPLWSRVERTAARGARHVILNNASRARVFASTYNLPIMPTVVPTALPGSLAMPDPDSERIGAARMALGIPPASIVVMHPGPPADVRCSAELLAAVRQRPDMHLLMTGISEAALGAFLQEHGQALDPSLRQRTHLHPRLEFGALMELVSLSDVGLLLYRNDGIGNFFQSPGRFTEYAFNGLYIVASDTPTLAELVREYGFGSLCKSHDPHSILGALDRAAAAVAAGKGARRARTLRARGQFALEQHVHLIDDATRM